MGGGLVLLEAADGVWYLVNVNLLHIAYVKHNDVVLEYEGGSLGAYYIPCGSPKAAKGILNSLFWGNEKITGEGI